MNSKVFLVLIILFCSACSLLHPSPIPNSSYLSDVPGELDEKNTRSPFQRTWIDKPVIADLVGMPGVTVKKVTVRTDTLAPSARPRLKSFEDIKEDAPELATLFEKSIIKALQDYPDKKTIYDPDAAVDDKTVEIEIAIVELVPQDVLRKVLSTGLGFVSVFGSVLGFYGDSVIAIEGKLIRTQDRKILVAIADRHSGKIAPVDLRIVSQYHQARENIREWSNSIAELMNTPVTHKVEGESVITIYPW